MSCRYISIFILVGFLHIVLFISSVEAQTTGNPAILEQKSWSLGLSAEYARYNLENIEYTSIRGLLKGDITAAHYVTVSIAAGLANMKINYPLSYMRTRLDSKNSLAVGVSAKVNGIPAAPQYIVRNISFLTNLKIIGDGGALWFTPMGHSYSTSPLVSGDVYYKFDWREFYGSLGTILLLKQYDIYVCYQGRAIRQYEKFSRQLYRSGIMSSVIVGLEVKLSHQYVINLQVRSFNGSAVSLGMSQSVRF